MGVRPELRFRLPNSPGSLARIMTVLASEQVRVLALSVDSTLTARLIVDNPVRAADALRQEHVAVEQRDVIYVLVPARSIAAVLRSVADAGVNIEYSYASSFDTDAALALVLGVDDALRASSAAGL